jgi:O-antigen/teichoic acid export membrane protein
MPELTTDRRVSGRARVSKLLAPNTLSRKASLTTVASTLDYVARISVQFAINPLMVGALGSYLYGAWRVLYSLNGYLWAASGRSAQALTWVIAHHRHSITDEQKRQYVGSAVMVWFVFLPFLALVGGLGAWFAPLLLDSAPRHVWDIRFAAALLTADAIALTLLSIPRSALQGENLGYKRMGLSTLLILVGGAFMALAVYFDTGIAGVAVANAAGTVVTGLLFWRVAKRHLPWFGFSRPARTNVRWFLGLSGWFTAWKLVYELMTAGDVVALGLFGSVELVTVYTLTKFVTQSLIPLIAVVFEGASPGLGALIGRGDTGRGIKVRNEIMSFTWLLCTALGASLLVWNPSFVGLWVGARFYAGSIPMLLIVLLVTQFAFVGNDARFIDLTLKVRAKVVLGAISAVLSIVLAAVFVTISEDKITGMALGIIAGRLILTVAYPWLIGRLLGHSFLTQLRGLPRPAAVTAALFGGALWLGENVGVNSWMLLAAWGVITAAAAALVAGGLGMSRSQRAALFKRLSKVVKGSGGGSSDLRTTNGK